MSDTKLLRRFAHDCPSCRYLGYDGRQAEWYHCPGILGGSIIGRYGDRPEQYWSMPVGVLLQADPAPAGDFHREARRLIAEHKLEWTRKEEP